MMKRNVLGTMSTTQTRIKIVVQDGMIRLGNRRKLSSSSELVLREEGPDSTGKKISTIMI